MQSDKLQKLHASIKNKFKKYGISHLTNKYVLQFSLDRTVNLTEMELYEADQLLNHLKEKTKGALITDIYDALYQIGAIEHDRQTIVNDKNILKYLGIHTGKANKKFKIQKRLSELSYDNILDLSILTANNFLQKSNLLECL